jgi:hypothetical protein
MKKTLKAEIYRWFIGSKQPQGVNYMERWRSFGKTVIPATQKIAFGSMELAKYLVAMDHDKGKKRRLF